MGKTLRMNIIRDRTYDFNVSKLYDTSQPVVRYSRNQWGLRDDCGAPGGIDILTIGGSTTDQRYIPFESTWQETMEADLARRLGHPICVSNAGVDGQSTFGHQLAFRNWFPLIPDLKPRLVVFYIGINDADFTMMKPSHFDQDNTGGKRSRLRQLEISRIWYWLSDTIRGLIRFRSTNLGHRRESFAPADYTAMRLSADTPDRARRHAEQFRLRLRSLIEQARKLDADVLCVTQPHRMVKIVDGKPRGLPEALGWPDQIRNGLDYDWSIRRLNAVMAQECGESRLVDLYSQRFDDSEFYDFMHTKPAGSRKIGHILAERLAREDMAGRFAPRHR